MDLFFQLILSFFLNIITTKRHSFFENQTTKEEGK